MRYSKVISIKIKEPITSWTVTKNRYGQAPISITYHFDPEFGIRRDKTLEICDQIKEKFTNII